VFAALRRGSMYDNLATSLAIAGIAIPNFFLAILLIIVFAVQLKVLPSSGSRSWQHIILPALAQSTNLLALVARMVRSSMLEVLGQDYIRTARAKGLHNFTVIVRHALRNALLPVTTVVALAIPAFIGYMVVIETLFGWPGMGSLMLQSVLNRDYPVVLASVLVMSIITVLVFLVLDLLYAYLDPRIRFE